MSDAKNTGGLDYRVTCCGIDGGGGWLGCTVLSEKKSTLLEGLPTAMVLNKFCIVLNY